MFAPGMTGQQAFAREPSALDHTEAVYSLYGIFRTGRDVATAIAQ